MEMLHFLDVSHDYLRGSLQRKFLMGCYSLRFLKLSHNKFSGHIFSSPANLEWLAFLIADNNQFTGISDGLLRSKTLSILDVSNNYLQGIIPNWLGEFSFTFLLASDNRLEGTIPSKLFNASRMKLLDLSGNKLSGNLPLHFKCLDMGMLFLNDNELSGPIPGTLLENLIVLDLRNNKLSGKIPRFVNNKYVLSLLLRGNTLTGHIPTNLCGLRSIKILDLANNNLNGFIPSCLNNISFGRSLEYEVDGYGFSSILGLENELGTYHKSLLLPYEFVSDYSRDLDFIVEFASKSRYDSYTGRSFDFMSGLDLSSNDLSGKIPTGLGDLKRLRALNLSHNSLLGLIPESFSGLTDIESIDLSFNMLHGPIPEYLTKLDYMVVFNVSYNNLSGSIPSHGKFLTLDETNFMGNPLLCGSAINKTCIDSNTVVSEEPSSSSGDEETTIDMEIFYWSLAATYGITWIALIVFLCFDSTWLRAWFRLIDAFIKRSKCL